MSERSQLFELLQLFQWMRFERREREQSVATICIKAEVMKEHRRLASEVRLGVANERDRASAEIERSAGFVANHFHTVRIAISLVVCDRHRERRNLCFGIGSQELGEQFE